MKGRKDINKEAGRKKEKDKKEVIIVGGRRGMKEGGKKGKTDEKQ